MVAVYAVLLLRILTALLLTKLAITGTCHAIACSVPIESEQFQGS